MLVGAIAGTALAELCVVKNIEYRMHPETYVHIFCPAVQAYP